MKRVVPIAILGMLTFNITGHTEGIDNKANAFANLYLKLCMKNINDFESLRTQLTNNKLSKFPPEQAALFLRGQQGDAWPIPHQGKLGNFVLVLPSDKRFCAIHARRADQTEVEQQFTRLVSKAPPPLVSELKKEEEVETSKNGRTHTISYAWSLPQANRKILFTLTTASSENASLQALGSTAIITE